MLSTFNNFIHIDVNKSRQSFIINIIHKCLSTLITSYFNLKISQVVLIIEKYFTLIYYVYVCLFHGEV